MGRTWGSAPVDRTPRGPRSRIAIALLLAFTVVGTSAGSCGDGNQGDDPQKGFEKCLPGADKKVGVDC